MSYAPQSPDLSAVPESAASYYAPHDAFALQGQHPHPQQGYPPYGFNTAAPAFGMAKPAPSQDEDKPYPGQLQNITVKTKFPVARIKRIVQADEEVGKVAQVTPVVVSKALELFMIALALSSADQARARNSKRVTAAHLKLAVAQDDQFDFLSEITDKIADAPAAAAKDKGPAAAAARRRSHSGDESDDPGRKRSTRGRKKKPKDEDDEDW